MTTLILNACPACGAPAITYSGPRTEHGIEYREHVDQVGCPRPCIRTWDSRWLLRETEAPDRGACALGRLSTAWNMYTESLPRSPATQSQPQLGARP